MTDFPSAQNEMNKLLAAHTTAIGTAFVALVGFLEKSNPGLQTDVRKVLANAAERENGKNIENAKALAQLANMLTSK